ncbi:MULTISPECIES: YybH family protein [unclassified Streptomyces]|uniref:YybH family protein n=1 Tax=unclassified Streptomyces TaxID=2593676 RepID=UPI0038653157
MSIERDHAPTVTLTADPGQHPAVFAAAFNTGDPAAVAQVYAPDAVFVPRPGTPLTGAALASATAEFLALGLPIEVSVRHTYTAGDLALLIVDWSISGTGPDGAPVTSDGDSHGCGPARVGRAVALCRRQPLRYSLGIDPRRISRSSALPERRKSARNAECGIPQPRAAGSTVTSPCSGRTERVAF